MNLYFSGLTAVETEMQVLTETSKCLWDETFI